MKRNIIFTLLHFLIFTLLHHGSASSTQQQGDDVTDHLKDSFYSLVHNFDVLNGELLGLSMRPKPPLFYPTKLQNIIENTKRFTDYFSLRKQTYLHSRKVGK